jgi:hypothetical protein
MMVSRKWFLREIKRLLEAGELKLEAAEILLLYS